MRRVIIGTAAVIATTLAAPTPALAKELQVQASGGDSSCTGNICSSIGAAASHVVDNDTITIHPKAGGWTESASFQNSGLTIRGADAQVVVNGTLTLSLVTVANATSTVTFQRLTILGSGGPGIDIESPAGDLGAKAVTIDSSILSGSGTAQPGLKTNTNGKTTVTARHVTIADSGSAPATSIAGASGTKADFAGSIVNGATTGTNNFTATDTSTSKGSLFVDPSGEDFHLLANAPAIDNGGSLASGELAVDVDGQARPFGAAVDQGADEFYDTPPSTPTVTANPQSAYPGDTFSFTASATDPDAGGSVVGYRWNFGDGTTREGGASQTHPYAAPGPYDVTVQAVDNNGQPSPAGHVQVSVVARPTLGGGGSIGPLPRLGSAAAAGSAGDRQPPSAAIGVPRPGQRLRIGRAVPSLRGRAADDSGVLSVELALARRRGAGCQWFDGRRTFRTGSCGRPTWFRAVVDDFAWRYDFASGVRPAPGAYSLSIRATDIRGNRTAATASAARAATFRFVR
jgi:hypothetical protein